MISSNGSEKSSSPSSASELDSSSLFSSSGPPGYSDSFDPPTPEDDSGSCSSSCSGSSSSLECGPLPDPITITIADSLPSDPGPGVVIEGEAYSAWLPWKWLECFWHSAELISATLDNEGSVAGVDVSNGRQGSLGPPLDNGAPSILESPNYCSVGISTAGAGPGQFRFAVPYSVTNYPPVFEGAQNPASISAVVVVTFEDQDA